jgi:diguanylate cyclase (GGDEF)-like protein/PAS domain S-box-containing protein
MTKDDQAATHRILMDWMQSVMHDSTDMIFVKDLDLVYVAASRAFTEMLGLASPAAAVGRTDFDLFADQSLARQYIEDDRRMMKSGRNLAPYVEPLPERNGETAWSLTRKGLVRDQEGRIVGVYGIGTDVTELVRAERKYAEEIRNIESLSGGAIMAKLQANLTKDTFVTWQSRFRRDHMSYSQGLELLAGNILTREQRDRVCSTLGREALLSAFSEGKTSFSVQYQALIETGKRPLWLRTLASVYQDSVSGDIMCFQYAYNVDDEMAAAAIADTLKSSFMEMAALIYPGSGWVHDVCHASPDQASGRAADGDYSSRAGELIERFVCGEYRTKAREQLSLKTVVAVLARRGEYKVIFPVEYGGKRHWKKWSFFWQDADRTAILMICADVTDEETMRAANSEMDLALRSSQTVIAHYDAVRRALVLPEEYAGARGLPRVLRNIPYGVTDISPGDRDAYIRFYEGVLKGEAQGEATLLFTLPNGQTTWEYITFHTQFDSGHSPVGAVVTIRDVTAQHEREVEDQRNRILIEQNNIAIVDYDVRNDTLHFEVKRADQGIVKKTFAHYCENIDESVGITAEGAEAIRSMLREAVKKATTGTLDYRADIWGAGYRWVRLCYSTLDDKSGRVYRLIGQVSDIQPERDREALLQELSRHIRKDQTLRAYDPVVTAKIFQYLYGTTDMDEAIHRVLSLLGEHYGVSRAYVFEDNLSHTAFCNTYEWCAPGITPQKEQLQDISYDEDLGGIYPSLFDENNICLCPDIHTLPKPAQEILAPQGIRGVLLCNLLDNGAVFGMVGFDDCAGGLVWTDEMIGTLSLAAMMIGTFLSKLRVREFAELSEDFLAALDDNASYIYIVDPDTYRIVYVNRALSSRFGEGQVGKICYQAAVGRDTPCAGCSIQRLRANGVSRPVEVRRGDGLWMLSQANRIHWAGRPMYMITCTDITARKEAEAQARFHDYCIHQIDKALSAGTIINGLGRNAPLYYVSGNIETLLGYSVEEFKTLYHERFAQMIYAEDDQRVRRQNRRYAREQPPYFEMEFRFVRKDSTVFWVLEKATRLDDFQGRRAYLSIFVDISSQKAAQEEHTIQEEAYRIAVEHSNSLVYRYDIRKKSIYMPPEVAKSCHMPSLVENMPEGAVRAGHIAEESVSAYIAFYRAIADGVEGRTVEIKRKLCDDQYRWFRGEYTIIRGKDGRPASAIVTFTDIEEEKKKEWEIAALKENEQLLRIVAKHSQRIIVLYDFATDTFQPYAGGAHALHEAALSRHSPDEYFTPEVVAQESAEQIRAGYEQLRSGKPEGTAKFRMKLTGAWRWYDCVFSTVYDAAQKPSCAIVSLEDVTDSYEREVTYRRYQNLLVAADMAENYYLEYDLTRNTLESDSGNFDLPMFAEIAREGYGACIQYIGEHFVIPSDRESYRKFFGESRLTAAFANGTTRGEMDIRIKRGSDKEPIYVRMSYQMVKDPYTANTRLLFSCRIVDKEVKAQLDLRQRAELDPVTGILNRATFIQQVRERIETVEPGLLCAFAILDVDHFKRVNDTFGHVYGDQVLHDVAHTIRSVLFRDDLVGRIGGDEFGLLIGGFPDLKTLSEKLELLRTAVFRELRDGVRISASIGITLFPQDGTAFESLYAKADIALYRGKSDGRDRCVFYSEDMKGLSCDTMLSPIDEADDQQPR